MGAAAVIERPYPDPVATLSDARDVAEDSRPITDLSTEVSPGLNTAT